MDKYKRIENALWGLFISDSLSMPAHWYYKLEYLKKDFGKIKDYNDAPHPHPESFMVGATYKPDIIKAKSFDREFDILGKFERFYSTSYNHLNIQTTQHSGEHKNPMPELHERYHYHHGLKAGENTLGANLVRILIRSIIRHKGYDEDKFLDEFISFMTSDKNTDAYTEIYLRSWFEKYSQGLDKDLCAQKQRNVWSIGSHGGIIRPLVLSLISKNAYAGLGVAITHQNLTHRSENVSSALSILVPLFYDLLKGKDSEKSILKYSKRIKSIKIKGEELSKIYRDNNGPSNIKKDKMWKIHNEYSDENIDIENLLQTYTDEELIGKVFSTACYPEHGIPLLLCLMRRNNDKFLPSVLANANAGGDNVHRGMIMGLLAGACAKEIPSDFKLRLKNYKDIDREIKEFILLLKSF